MPYVESGKLQEFRFTLNELKDKISQTIEDISTLSAYSDDLMDLYERADTEFSDIEDS